MLLETSDGTLQFKELVKWVFLKKTEVYSVIWPVIGKGIDSGCEMLTFIAFALGRLINIVL